jgi:hypothetical protein
MTINKIISNQNTIFNKSFRYYLKVYNKASPPHPLADAAFLGCLHQRCGAQAHVAKCSITQHNWIHNWWKLLKNVSVNSTVMIL